MKTSHKLYVKPNFTLYELHEANCDKSCILRIRFVFWAKFPICFEAIIVTEIIFSLKYFNEVIFTLIFNEIVDRLIDYIQNICNIYNIFVNYFYTYLL